VSSRQLLPHTTRVHSLYDTSVIQEIYFDKESFNAKLFDYLKGFKRKKTDSQKGKISTKS
jgi:hypothetical protein